MLLAAALMTPEAPSPTAATPQRNAQAMVQIMRPAELRFEEIERDQPQRLRESFVRSADGLSQPARLVEFQ